MKIWLVLLVTGSLWFCAEYICAEPGDDSAKGDDCVGRQANSQQDQEAAEKTGGRKQAKYAGLEVIARVNGVPVTRAQFDQMVGNPLTLRQAQQEFGIEKPERKELESLAMRRLIHLRLLAQEASRRKITVTRNDLDEAISKLRHRFNDLAGFGAWIQQQGINELELFTVVHTDMLAKRVSADLVKDVRITEEQAQQYYEAHRGELIIGMEVRLRIIAVDNRADANEIAAILKKGDPFDILARRRSMGLLAAKGGDTGWVNLYSLPSPLLEVAGSLKTGEICGPLEKDSDEFLIVGLQDRRPVHAKSLAEAMPVIEGRLRHAMQQETVQAWLKKQQEKAKIEVFLEGECCMGGEEMSETPDNGM